MRYSFEIVGEIALVEIPKEFEDRKEEIAREILSRHKNVKSVYKKGRVIGEERVREIEFILGERISETIHKEFGLRYKLDISKVYFSPRLAYERDRISKQVKDNEIIIDMFSGVGPFSILIAKRKKVKVLSIDKNIYAYKYLKENIKINKVVDKVIALNSDVRDVYLEDVADRVIMNLPLYSHKFLYKAIEFIKDNSYIHIYYLDENERELYKFLDQNLAEYRICFKRNVKSYAPHRYIQVMDIFVVKK